MKKLLILFSFALAALLLAVPSTTYAQAANSGFSGKAVRWNGEPIVGATVSVLTGPLETDTEVARATTGADGSWSIAAPAGGPYWVHIHTFGSWWGYSYQDPFSLVNGEQVSQIYLLLGPREVNEIAIPTPESNVGPEIGVEPTETPVSEVAPIIGVDPDMPVGMPTTGGGPAEEVPYGWLIATAGLLVVAGFGARKIAQSS